jgi:hypothetical protein
MPLNIEITAQIEGTYTGSNDLSAPEQTLKVKEILAYITGSGAGQAAIVFADTRTLAASASESLDLAGALSDAFGQSITFPSVKAILVKAHPDNVNNVVVGDAAANAFVGPMGATGTLILEPGDFALLASKTGFVVTPATGDLLKVANSGAGTGVTYDIVIIG